MSVAPPALPSVPTDRFRAVSGWRETRARSNSRVFGEVTHHEVSPPAGQSGSADVRSGEPAREAVVQPFEPAEPVETFVWPVESAPRRSTA